MKNVTFRDVTPFDFCTNRRFGATYRLHHQAEKSELGTMLAVTNNGILEVFMFYVATEHSSENRPASCRSNHK
jgi:hypothetical protein